MTKRIVGGLIILLFPILAFAQDTKKEFFDAIRYGGGDTTKLRQLLQKGADVSAANEISETPLTVAVSINNLRTVNFLLAAGANVEGANIAGDNALMMATRISNVMMVKALLAAGASPTAKNMFGGMAAFDAHSEEMGKYSNYLSRQAIRSSIPTIRGKQYSCKLQLQER